MNLLEGLVKCGRLLFDLCFPRICAVCGVPLNCYEQHFCLECFADLPLTYFWNMEETPAERVFWGRCPVERVHSLFYYTDNYRKAVHHIKYNGNIPLGLHLGRMLGERIVQYPNAAPIDYIVPVPLHWRKKLKRGYNQAEIIASGIQKGMQDFLPDSNFHGPIVLPTLLRRKSFTATQTAKDRISRWHNVKDAFEANPACKVCLPEGSHILICDDVLTTGATLEACAAILVEEFGCRVSIATLAYVE